MENIGVSIPEGEYKNKDAVENVINYVCRLGNKELIGGYGVNLTNVQDVINQFYIVKNIHGVLGGKQIMHIIFTVEKTLYFKAEHVKELGYLLARYFASERQVLFAVHDDTEYLHIHMAVNTVAYTNGKYQAFWNIEDLREYAKLCMMQMIDKVWFGKTNVPV